MTIESLHQFDLIAECAASMKKEINIILRLTNGSQFGINEEDIEDLVSRRGAFPYIHMLGVQYFTGTQKKKCDNIIHELDYAEEFCSRLMKKYNYKMEQKAHWDALDKVFGSASGEKLMKYAQEYTLDILLGVANEHLTDMTKRYRLERIAGSGLGIKVIDLDMMAESRSAHTLSGGETFIVSLALSLALSSLSSNRMKIESLFIDEGFGALDKDTLQTALMMLDKLQSSGRKVGVISHLTEMLEQIPVKVNVVRLSPGRSKVEITGNKHLKYERKS
jgi:exonuclease SbcC